MRMLVYVEIMQILVVYIDAYQTREGVGRSDKFRNISERPPPQSGIASRFANSTLYVILYLMDYIQCTV